MKVEIQFIMNKLIYILFFLLVPALAISQSRELKELYILNQIEQGNYSRALDTIELLLNTYQNNDLRLAKINALYKLREYDEALILADKLNKTSNGIASVIQLKIYLEKDDFENAEQILMQNLKSRYKISLFDLLNQPGYNKLTGSEIIDHILKSNVYSATEKQLFQVEKLVNNEKYDQAEFLVDQIINRNDKVAQAYYFKSLIERNKGFKNTALDLMNTAIEIKPSKPEFYIQRAELLIDLEKYKQAQFDIDKLTKIKPADLNIYTLKADLLLQNKEYQKVIQLTDDLFKLDLKNQDLLYSNSKANYELGNNMQALKSVNELFKTESSKKAFELRGDIYMQTKTYEFAIQDYSMFLDIEPYNGTIYNKKALARYYTGDREGACYDWEKAKRYGSYDAIKNLERYCK